MQNFSELMETGL